jgi:hypothetical protein
MTDVMSRGRLLNAELMSIENWTILCSKSTTSILPGTQKRDEPQNYALSIFSEYY